MPGKRTKEESVGKRSIGALRKIATSSKSVPPRDVVVVNNVATGSRSVAGNGCVVVNNVTTAGSFSNAGGSQNVVVSVVGNGNAVGTGSRVVSIGVDDDGKRLSLVDGKLKISSSTSSSDGKLKISSTSSDLEIPGGKYVSVEATTISGSVSQSGPIECESIVVTTVDGAVDLRDVRCERATIGTTSGNVVFVRKGGGRCEGSVASTSGDVTAIGSNGLRVSSVSGDVVLRRGRGGDDDGR